MCSHRSRATRWLAFPKARGFVLAGEREAADQLVACNRTRRRWRARATNAIVGPELVSVRSRCASEGIQSLNWRLSIRASLGRSIEVLVTIIGHIASLPDHDPVDHGDPVVAVVDEALEVGHQ